MATKGIPVEATMHVLNRCNELLNRKSGTHNVKQEYYYQIEWLRLQFKYFHKLNEVEQKKLLKNLHKNKYLVEDIGKFKK